MAQTTQATYGEVAKVALELWRALRGAGIDMQRVPSPEERQNALLLYAECVKAVEGDPFDVTKLT